MTKFSATFWGVRGTVPISSTHNLRYGGNTSCVEISIDDKTIVLDAGTGIFPLGQQCDTKEIDILLSHLHIDHIQGLPFFAPIYEHERVIRIWAGNLLPEYHLEEVLSGLIKPPVFPPVIFGKSSATLEFYDFHAGESLTHDTFSQHAIKIHTLPLHHPGGATGYRITYHGKSLCYITDVEHEESGPNPDLIEFIKDTDLFIYDCTYDDDTYANHKGWGHSTWQHAVLLAKEAGVKKLVDFHHDPFLNDQALQMRESSLHHIFPSSVVAYEGLHIIL